MIKILQSSTAETSESVNRKASNIPGVTILGNGEYKILYKPNFLNPFEARGTIRLLITGENEKEATRIEWHIRDDLFPAASKTVILTLMVVWSVAVLLIPPFTRYSLLLVIVGWVVALICWYAMKRLNRVKLMNNAKQIMRLL